MIVLHFICEGEIFLSVLMASVNYLDFSMQEEDILERINGKCHLCTLQSTCRPLCSMGHAPHNTIEHTHAKILVSALERQVS
jgi:hypothetical protein